MPSAPPACRACLACPSSSSLPSVPRLLSLSSVPKMPSPILMPTLTAPPSLPPSLSTLSRPCLDPVSTRLLPPCRQANSHDEVSVWTRYFRQVVERGQLEAHARRVAMRAQPRERFLEMASQVPPLAYPPSPSRHPRRTPDTCLTPLLLPPLRHPPTHGARTTRHVTCLHPHGHPSSTCPTAHIVLVSLSPHTPHHASPPPPSLPLTPTPSFDRRCGGKRSFRTGRRSAARSAR